MLAPRREVWVDEATRRVSRYNLACINHALYAGDTVALSAEPGLWLRHMGG